MPGCTADPPVLLYPVGHENDPYSVLYNSHTKPFTIMAVIPFAFIGVIPGHWILGAALSAVSFRSVFGLSGVIVNDSLVMIDFIDQKLGDGIPVRTTVIEGAKGRFRPTMLMSVTTSLAFAPLLLERPFRRSS